jgi:hypothetical protein
LAVEANVTDGVTILTLIVAVRWRRDREICCKNEEAQSDCAALEGGETLHDAPATIETGIIVAWRYMYHYMTDFVMLICRYPLG